MAANDEFFADEGEPAQGRRRRSSCPTTFGAKGQVYDGWETGGGARRRHLPTATTTGDRPPRRARRRARGRGRHRFFTGNYPQACSVEACSVAGYPGRARRARTAGWHEIVPRGLVTGDTRHAFAVSRAAGSPTSG